MRQPENYAVNGRETDVCWLISIYGLKQAPCVWNMDIDDTIVKYGLTRSQHVPCLNFRFEWSESTILSNVRLWYHFLLNERRRNAINTWILSMLQMLMTRSKHHDICLFSKVPPFHGSVASRNAELFLAPRRNLWSGVNLPKKKRASSRFWRKLQW